MSNTDASQETTAPSRQTTEPNATGDDSREPERAELARQNELLESENRRLRNEYARVKRVRYRTRAIALALVGLFAIGASLLLADVRDVLLALGATGLFAAVLTYYLSPGAFVPADVGERVYAALAANQRTIAEALGLGDERLYVPETERGSPACRLFVPRYRQYEFPDGDDGPIVTDETARGLVLEPTGHHLFEEFERTLAAELARTPSPLSAQLADALVEQFEFARSATVDVDPTRVTFAVTESTFGDVDRFDHPIASFLAVGLAVGLEHPIALEVAGDEQSGWLITCRWELEAGADTTADVGTPKSN
ncbi:hypothetical protein [Natrarchaeobius chitinivorans]|uniref:DUF7982 domain-containing protein n=1 Tax=Natrarchaeobius chitinivorans TaxID=1679083 RepID=A0A3N6MZG1_NATCH|nr:hypothetical protein [Natrarchaeobius chitinivorans]RQG90982.1 hypothetical protein EA473_19555 [Natrarchaeobius chitinivorans]